MPHVKGNKFKPASSNPPAEETRKEHEKAAVSKAPEQPVAVQAEAQRVGKKKRKRGDGPPKAPLVLPSTVVAQLPKPSKAAPALASTNWLALKAAMAARPARPRRPSAPSKAAPTATANKPGILPDQHSDKLTPVMALDCEMVGIGPRGNQSSVARWDEGRVVRRIWGFVKGVWMHRGCVPMD